MIKLFVNDLTVIDSSYLCPRRGLVGESWIVDLELSGELNQQKMLWDFAKVKRAVKAQIDQEVDHKLIVPESAPQITVSCCDADDSLWVDFEIEPGDSIHLKSPASAFALVPESEINNDSLAGFITRAVRQILPENITGLKIRLRNEAIDGAYYHYSHGLKHHDGNCQRIAHGHRSMIELWVDGQRNEEMEWRWSERWRDIYLGSEDDLRPVEQLPLSEEGRRLVHAEHLGFYYRAFQGEFALAIGRHRVELVDCDTTVESLAGYIARELPRLCLGEQFKVRAYEGIGKGAEV